MDSFLSGAVALTKNADTDKYEYSGYGVWFNRHGRFSDPSGRTGINYTIFEVDMGNVVFWL